MTTAVEASALMGNGICSSRSDDKEDRSNCGNDGNSSNPEGGRNCCTSHDADRADNDKDGGNDRRWQPRAMLLGLAAQRAYPES